VQLELLLRKLLARRGTAADLDELERLCAVVSAASLCGLGQSAPRPLLSTLRHFRSEYMALLQPEQPEQPEQPLAVASEP
jgi:bidirectional [NiFe] hydrogenase diaphorase subunit